jgi:hypothetical protein
LHSYEALWWLWEPGNSFTISYNKLFGVVVELWLVVICIQIWVVVRLGEKCQAFATILHLLNILDILAFGSR